MTRRMPWRTWHRAMAITVGGMGASAAWVLLFIMQPWRSCPDDDVPAGCPALPRDTALLMVGIVVFLVCFVAVIVVSTREHVGRGDKPHAMDRPVPSLRWELGLAAAIVGIVFSPLWVVWSLMGAWASCPNEPSVVVCPTTTGDVVRSASGVVVFVLSLVAVLLLTKARNAVLRKASVTHVDG